MASGWFTRSPVLNQRADSAPILPDHLAHVISPDEFLVVLANAGRFDWLLRKDDYLDEGVAAIFGLAGAKAELLGLCFHVGKFNLSRATAWLAERRFTPLAGPGQVAPVLT